MKPRIRVLTLGVSDLERALRFYRDGLGLPTEGIIGTEVERGAVAFFDLEDGLKLALFLHSDFAHDAGVLRVPPASPSATMQVALRRLMP
jgi:catechol 2,3-dioxygenase-like lactoylglutathione lyase family enzyme